MTIASRVDAQGHLLVDFARLGGFRVDAQGRAFLDPDQTAGVARRDAAGHVFVGYPYHGEPVYSKLSLKSRSSKGTNKSVYAKVRTKPKTIRTVQKSVRAKVSLKSFLPQARRTVYVSVYAKLGLSATASKQVSKSVFARLSLAVDAFARRATPPKLNLGAYLSGRSGSIEPRVALWVSNNRGEEIKEIVLADSAGVDLNNFRDHTWELKASMRATDEYDPLTDYLKPTVDLWNPNAQRYERYPMGLYQAFDPNEEILESSRRWTIQGRSPENLLAEDMSPGSYAVAKGSGILGQVRGILSVGFGVPPEMVDFPPPTMEQTLPEDMIFDIVQDTEGCYWLNIVNSLLAAGAFRPLQTDALGRFLTRKFDAPGERPADILYGEGGEEIVSAERPLDLTRSAEEFANKIIALSNDNAMAPIAAVAVNNNPNSRFSVPSLNGRTITKTLQLQQLVSPEAAQLIADVELARRSGVFEKLAFETPIDPRRGPHEIAEFNYVNPDGSDLMVGRFAWETWSVDLAPLVGMMSHAVSRISEI